MRTTPDPMDDVLESCADALLTVAALALQLRGQAVSYQAAADVCADALGRVLERSQREGPKPR